MSPRERQSRRAQGGGTSGTPGVIFKDAGAQGWGALQRRLLGSITVTQMGERDWQGHTGAEVSPQSAGCGQ